MQDFLFGGFEVSNFLILLGYFTTSALTLPFPGTDPLVWRAFGIHRWWVRLSGSMFFLGCGLTHLELWLHSMTGEPLDRVAFSTWHMFLIHVLQGFAIVGFLTGCYLEVVKEYVDGGHPEPASVVQARSKLVGMPITNLELVEEIHRLEQQIDMLGAARMIVTARIILGGVIVLLLAVFIRGL